MNLENYRTLKEGGMSDKFTKVSVFIYSGGCSSNWAEGRTVINFLEANGHRIVDSIEGADIVIFNACSFDEAEKRGTAKIRAIVEQKLDARLIMMGCVQKRMLANLPADTIVIPPKDIVRFNVYFTHLIPIEEIPPSNDIQAPGHWVMIERYVSGSPAPFFEAFKGIDQEIEVLPNLKDEAWLITTSVGCLGNCSYCGIRKNRGALKSFPIEKLLKEFHHGLSLGKSYFKIWGVDVGYYGKDIGTDLAELLESILRIDREFQLEILAANPRAFMELFDKLLPVLKDQRIDRLVIPVQSGSRKILKAMNRGIDPAIFIEKINQLRAEAPWITILTHYIVGFPGETDADFGETILLMHRAKLYHCLINKFDAKEDTLAARMEDQIVDEIKEVRKEVLQEICRRGVEKYFPGTVY